MKKDFDLRAAFPDIPEDCKAALMSAACSVKEETKMKKFTFRTLLIAAVLIIATMTAAVAATDALGWTDFFNRYENIMVPTAAQTILNSMEEKSYQAGPLTFTVKQRLCDSHLAMAAADIRTTDGSEALYCFDCNDALGSNGENGQALAKRLGLPEETTFLEAAKKLNLPLYLCYLSPDMDQDYCAGEATLDIMWNEDNTVTSFAMMVLEPEKIADKQTIPFSLHLLVCQIDPESGEQIENTYVLQTETIDMPIQGVIAKRDFTPEEPFTLNDCSLSSVHAEQTVCGLYLDRAYTADEKLRDVFENDPEASWDITLSLWKATWMQENGQPFPEGISTMGEFDDSAFPILHFRDMISVDEMPQILILETADQQVTLK